MMQTILVTGGAGFIGSSFVRRLIGDSMVRVVVLDKLTYAGNLDSLASVSASERLIFHRAGIEDYRQVLGLLQRYSPESVVNFAAETHVDRSVDSPMEFVNTNVLGTFQLLEAVRAYWRDLAEAKRRAFRFLHVSTDEVYGTLGPEGKFTEESKYAPNSPYAASKASSDHLVRAFYRTYGLPVLTTNSSNNYGPYQFPDKLIPLMILNVIEGTPLPVYGDGLNVRDWLFVNDHCRAIGMVLAKGTVGEVYNLGGNCERTNLTVVKEICEAVRELAPEGSSRGSTANIVFVPDRPGHDRRYAIDTTKAEQELGWRPEYRFEEAIRMTVQWYLENASWVQRVRDGTYAGERLGRARV